MAVSLAAAVRWGSGWCVAAVLPLLLCCGCSRPGCEPADVRGTVTLNGEPLSDVEVTFAPEASSSPAARSLSTGRTGPDGSYRLKAATGESGAALGWHRVVVEDLTVSAGAAANSRESADEQPPSDIRQRTQSRVPLLYATAGQSPLRLEVRPGENVLDLKLSR